MCSTLQKFSLMMVQMFTVIAMTSFSQHSCFLLIGFHPLLKTFLLLDPASFPRLTLFFLSSRCRIDHFSKKPWFLLYGNSIREHNLDTVEPTLLVGIFSRQKVGKECFCSIFLNQFQHYSSSVSKLRQNFK